MTLKAWKWKSESGSVVSNFLRPCGLYSPWNSPGQDTVVSSLSLLQGIFATQGWSPGLPHCRQILYQLSHKGSPRILEWVVEWVSLLQQIFLTQNRTTWSWPNMGLNHEVDSNCEWPLTSASWLLCLGTCPCLLSSGTRAAKCSVIRSQIYLS